jgi:hypothetical protein
MLGGSQAEPRHPDTRFSENPVFHAT